MAFGDTPLLQQVHDLKLALEKAGEKSRFLDESVDTMLEGYQIIDRDFRYVYVNSAAARHGQTTVESLTGQKMTDMYPGIETTEVFAKIREAMFDKRVFFLTNEFRFPDGSIGWFELRIQPVPQGVLIFSIDVTEREREKIRNEKLQQRLRQSERLDVIGRLSGSIAHDFNNMLTILLMGFDVLEQNLSDPIRAADELARLRDETARAARVAQQLLAFSRQKVSVARVVDLNDLIRGMEPMLRTLCSGSITLMTDLADNLDPIYIDPGFVEQIVLNLALNARDAMPDGGELKIHSKNIVLDEDYAKNHATCSPGKYAAILVHDTGRGMEREVLEKIFEPFFTTKPVGRGTGLGLATVYGLVNQSGGAVEVYSEPNRGTVFKIYLPISEVAAPSEIAVPGTEPVLKDKYRILLVDDEENLRQLIAKLLGTAGHTVVACGTMNEAYGVLIGNTPIDLIITDMSMPGGSGIDLIRSARKYLPHMPALLISGYSVEPGRLSEFGDNVTMLEKPFSKDQLVQTVQAIMKQN